MTVAGRRVRTVDVHAHCAVPDVLDVVKGTPFERARKQQLDGNLGFPVDDARVADMDSDGIDVQVLSINAFWYAADRDLARRIFDVQAQAARRDVQAFRRPLHGLRAGLAAVSRTSPPSSSSTA